MKHCRIAELPNCRIGARVAAVFFGAVFLFVGTPAWGCSIIFTPEKVKPGFVIQVKGFGEPVAGVRVEATHLTKSYEEDAPPRVSFSDPKGNAQFDGLPVGMYSIHADRFSANTLIEVVPEPKTKISYVQIGWPGTFSSAGFRVLKATQLSGRIVIETCQAARCTLLLRDGLTGEKIGDEKRGPDFDFGPLPFGPYMLRVKDDSGQTGDIAIRLSPDASSDRLEVAVGFSSCGIAYSETHECPADHLQASRLKGVVVDPAQAVIPHTTVRLLSSAETARNVEIMSTKDDQKGEWQFAAVPPGDYRLQLTRSGFTPHTVPLTVSLGAPSGDLHVTMGLMGSCSKSELNSEN